MAAFRVILAVALGGALGAVLRVAVGGGLMALFPLAFPWATLAVNLGGSFLLGFADARLPGESKFSGGDSPEGAGDGRRPGRSSPGGAGGGGPAFPPGSPGAAVRPAAPVPKFSPGSPGPAFPPAPPNSRTPGVSPLRAFLIPGFCGGFTTFSAFSIETLLLMEVGRGAMAALYLLVSVGVCVAGVMVGGRIGRG